MSEFTIHHQMLNATFGKNIIGVEIQPPIKDNAAQGLSRTLSKKKHTSFDTRSHVAESVEITRQDDHGTALVIEPNAYQLQPRERTVRAIGCFIDPARVHTITYVPPIKSA